MRKVIYLVIAAVLVIGAIIFSVRKQYSDLISLPHPTSLPVVYCTSQDLAASIDLSPGAGNVYGTLTIKNISDQNCHVLAGSFINANYDTAKVKNIKITDTGENQTDPYGLSPNQTLYSQVHFPNGPQCQSIGLNSVPVTFTYKISPAETITFKDQNGNSTFKVQACKTADEITEIKIWNISTEAITPN